MAASSLDIARVAAQAADSKKATDLVLIDLIGTTDVCDYFLICSGNNNRMVDSHRRRGPREGLQELRHPPHLLRGS